MKITFTYGDSVKIILNQDTDEYYVYTPEKNLCLPIKFFSVKDAITFFSNLLPIEAYDEDENRLDFIMILEYEDKAIDFCMSHEDITKIVWTDFKNENKGFQDYWSENRKLDDSIDDVVWYFIKWVKYTPVKKCSKFADDFFSKLEKERTYNATQNYYLQLSRLYIRDKELSYLPFELRGQLIEISILFDKPLEEVKKDYFERCYSVEKKVEENEYGIELKEEN